MPKRLFRVPATSIGDDRDSQGRRPGLQWDARLIKAQGKCSVVAADRSLTMAIACRARGGVLALVCDAAELPFPEMRFDGCRADRTLQHLQNPELAVAEMVRVTKVGGRVIAVDPDY